MCGLLTLGVCSDLGEGPVVLDERPFDVRQFGSNVSRAVEVEVEVEVV